MSCRALWKKRGSDDKAEWMEFADRIELIAFMKADGVEMTMSENNKNDKTEWLKEKR